VIDRHAELSIVWMLICGAFVFSMQAGFTCLESGMVRSKNSIHVAMKNFVDFCIAALAFWAWGFALMFGESAGGAFGAGEFFGDFGADAWLGAFFFFQLVFCGTATTIVSGAVAERMRFGAYLVVALVISGLVYPLVGHWAWGGVLDGEPRGWLERLGFVDFAGSTVVHSVGGWVAFAAVLVIGPRVGRFDGVARPIPGQDLVTSTLGALLLWAGWLGFNGGSTFGWSAAVPGIIVNTVLAGAAGGAASLVLGQVVLRRADVGWVLNGSLAGLVAVTASCHAVAPAGAVCLGASGAIVCHAAAALLERWRIDDAVGAISVHGASGVWGTVALPLFARPEALGTGLGIGEQLLVQLLGVGAVFAWALGAGLVVLKLVDFVVPLRSSRDDELVGLNVAEHGASTETFDLLSEMEAQRVLGDFSHRVRVEPNTDVGRIATQFNRVLDRVHSEAEAARRAHGELLRSNDALASARDDALRSGACLEEKIAEIAEFNRLAVGRELRMIELKREANELAQRAGVRPPYDLSFDESGAVVGQEAGS